VDFVALSEEFYPRVPRGDAVKGDDPAASGGAA
jgi:hypothetical protein